MPQPEDLSFKVWEKLYAMASEKYKKLAHESAGLFPHWVFQAAAEEKDKTNDSFGINRYTYSYPFSREKKGFDEAIKALIYYRAMLGSPNEEGAENDLLTVEEKIKSLLEEPEL